MSTAPSTPEGAYTLPHEDVVLYALVKVANDRDIHPYSLMQGISRRPAFNHWLTGNTSAMHYANMRLIIAKLVNQYHVKFDADGFSTPTSTYIRCRGISPPAIIANPSAL